MNMTRLLVRYAEETDLHDITSIFNQAINNQPSTGFLTPFSVEQRKPWFEKHKKETYPILITEINNRVIGWISISPYRMGRAAFIKTVEVSFFVHQAFQKQGIGSLLLKKMIEKSKKLEYQCMLAIVLDKNRGSIKLLENTDFDQCGFLPNVAEIHGQQYGHLYYCKEL